MLKIKSKVEDLKQRIQSEEFQQKFTGVKSSAKNTAHDSIELSKKISKTQLFRDIVPYAVICALIAIPMPLVSPLLGAAVGTGLGVYKNFKRK